MDRSTAEILGALAVRHRPELPAEELARREALLAQAPAGTAARTGTGMTAVKTGPGTWTDWSTYGTFTDGELAREGAWPAAEQTAQWLKTREELRRRPDFSSARTADGRIFKKWGSVWRCRETGETAAAEGLADRGGEPLRGREEAG